MLRLPLWTTVGFSWINVSVTQSRRYLMDPMAQTFLPRMLSGNTVSTYQVLSLLKWIEMKWNEIVGLGLILFSWYSSQFTPQGSDRPGGSGFIDSMVEVPWAAEGQGLTFIGYQVDQQLSLWKWLLSIIIVSVFSHKLFVFSVTGFIKQWKCSYRYSDTWIFVINGEMECLCKI